MGQDLEGVTDPPLELVVLVGMQASGKSSFRGQRFDATHRVVSKDLLRNHRRPAQRQVALIDQALAAGQSVVVDNTHPSRADRVALIEQAHRHGARVVGYVFDSDPQACRRRNQQREPRACVPEVAFRMFEARYEPPDLGEGYDALYRVTLREASGFEVNAWKE